MANPIDVIDARSNAPENIEYAATAIGRSSILQSIFSEIYRHQGAKSASGIGKKVKLDRLRVIKAIRPLVNKGLVSQERRRDDIYYGMYPFYKAHRDEILKYAKEPMKLELLVTKRRPSARVEIIRIQKIELSRISIPNCSFDARLITIDELGCFSKARGLAGSGRLTGMSEETFKKGVQSILHEPGEFKDWGGEKSDLFSTRLKIEGRRRAVAFAFKGPGLPGKLTIGRMGANGDQAPRLFSEPAEVFLVQHWREIDSQVVDLLRSLAIAKSATSAGKTIWFGVIDGNDSDRLVSAYPSNFSSL